MLNPPPDQPQWVSPDLMHCIIMIITPVQLELTLVLVPDQSSDLGPRRPPRGAGPIRAPRPPRPEPKPNRALGLLGKRTFDKPPPGRSTGIISFIGPSFGCIEREDLEKFNFSFSSFFGNPKAMRTGVRVHFTACKEKPGVLIATDVKVAPGGTENVDTEIYEAVVSQPIPEAEKRTSGPHYN
ncbi:Cold shock domain containing protein E1 [Dissostichus eleginoides]|uniref:Cold shock domain containing protein E1 n=1 Tax=Dissostichus eleginoides TaxID=100907 RepID=A0AAD9CNW8_DISEL|nr:Cold shock domain containing protein E1 [Dissostichus eleginoides]